MVEQMQSRLAELKREYQLGEQELRKLIQQEATVRETLLRISGAIQVLDELLPPDQAGEDTAREAETNAEPAVMTVP